MNHLLDYDRLCNRYIAFRHGHSLANQRNLVVSDPQNGCTGYGLSQSGRQQVEVAAGDPLLGGSGLLVFSSDFARTRETSDTLCRLLADVPAIEFDPRLRERYFGDFELGSSHIYTEVWRADAVDADDRPGGVESANEVMTRVTSLVADIENRYRQQSILLVSHGDPLQILQAAFSRRSASDHRRVDPLETAKPRLLRFG